MIFDLLLIILLGLILIGLWGGLGLYYYLKQKQKAKYLITLNKAKEPIPVISDDQKQLIMKWIGNKSTTGYFSSKREIYFPISYLQAQVDQGLKEKGFIDLFELIEQHQIPDEFIGAFTRGYLSNNVGFWDLMERRFYTCPRALEIVESELTDISTIPIRELLFRLGGWKEENLLEILTRLTDQETFRGFIDTQNILHIVFLKKKPISESKKYDDPVIVHYIKESLKTESKITFKFISKLFGIDSGYLKEIIQKYKNQAGVDVILSLNNDIFSLLDVYEQLIFDISTIIELNLNRWANQWNLDQQEVEKLLKQLNRLILHGYFTKNGYIGDINLPQLKFGVDINSIQNHLKLSTYNVAQLLGQLCMNKGLICVYQEGKIQGIITSLDILGKSPHHCPSCTITFPSFKNGKELKNCPLCKEIELELQISKPDRKFVDPRLKGVVRDLKAFQDSGTIIKLDSILRDIDLPQDKALNAVQDLIFRGFIKGKIDLSRQVFFTRVERIGDKPHCYICDLMSNEADIKFKCNHCGIQTCNTCFQQIEELDIEVCPLCGLILE